MSPLETRAEDLKVALRSPDAINLNEAKVLLNIGFQWSDLEGDQLSEVFDLSLLRVENPPASVTKDLAEGESVHVLQLAEEDYLRLSQAQERIKVLKEKHPKGKGWFTISLNKFCLLEEESKNIIANKDDLIVNIYLQTEKFKEYLHLIKNLNVSKSLDWDKALCQSENG